jgi:hypothetical protein
LRLIVREPFLRVRSCFDGHKNSFLLIPTSIAMFKLAIRMPVIACDHCLVTPLGVIIWTNNTHAHLCICRSLHRRRLCHRLQKRELRMYVAALRLDPTGPKLL